jgi:outer membrane biosynthesis protein TonB
VVSAQPFPFPDYDRTLVKSVYDRWQGLLNAEPQPAAQGKITVEFVLHSDGSISRLQSLPNQLSPRLEHLCERAVMELSPFPKWSPEMRREIGADTRSIHIDFDFSATKPLAQ